MDARVEKILNLPAWLRSRMARCFLLKKNQRIAAKLDVYREEYAKLQEKLSLALGELPLKKEIPSLLTNIGALAKEKGLRNIISLCFYWW